MIHCAWWCCFAALFCLMFVYVSFVHFVVVVVVAGIDFVDLSMVSIYFVM